MNRPEPKAAELPLSAQQLTALRQRQDEIIGRIKTDVELRKWAVDQACGLSGSALEFAKEPIDPVKLARQIHAFLTEAATEVK